MGDEYVFTDAPPSDAELLSEFDLYDMTALPRGREFTHWLLVPPSDPKHPANNFMESASTSLLSEEIRMLAEIPDPTKQRFSGNRSQRNVLWREYRNFLSQALSNFEGATHVTNRSSGLLLYYAALNFAKAELLDAHSSQLVNMRVGHGLSFSPTRAQSVVGDHLTVTDGVFSMLYERRTGLEWPRAERLPIRRILAQVPEIGQQIKALKVETNVGGIYHMFAYSGRQAWVVLAIVESKVLSHPTKTRDLLYKHFLPIAEPENWRDQFGLSRRFPWSLNFYQSIDTVAGASPGSIPMESLLEISWRVRDLFSLRTAELFDAWLSPYLYDTRQLVLPVSLARYALLFYASSLVRYKPSMFDPQTHPEQALLFDAIARECALPLLIETLSGLKNEDQIFFAADSYRL